MLNKTKSFSIKYMTIVAIALITTLGLAACSGGENSSQNAGNEATKSTESGDSTIVIEGLDTLQYSKTEIHAKPGQEITVKLVNNSTMPPESMSHDFVLLTMDADPGAFVNEVLQSGENGELPAGLAEMIIAKTELVGGGESDSVTFTVPEKTGEYTYVCTFPGHFAAGMKGKLIVE